MSEKKKAQSGSCENDEYIFDGDLGFNRFSELYQEIDSENNETNPHLISNLPRHNNNENIENFQYYDVNKFNENFGNTNDFKNDLKILNLNIRGLQKNYDNIIMYLNTITQQFDIMIMTEAHLQTDLANTNLHNKFPLEGFNMFYVKSKIKYGGVVIYVKNNLNASYEQNLTYSSASCDCIYIKVTNLNNTIYIGGYYRHCLAKSSEKLLFIEQLNENLRNKILKNQNIIIGGDFNICLMKSLSNDDSSKFLNTLLQNSMECNIFKPTRITYCKDSLQVKSATLIDQICTNLIKFKCKSGNLLYPNSDHCPSFLFVKNCFLDNKNNQKKRDNTIYRRNIKKINTDQLDEDLNKIDWDKTVFSEPNIDNCFENIIRQTEELLDKHAPEYKVPNRKIKYCYKPWIDKELLSEIREKNKLYKNKIKKPNTENKENYRIQKNKVTKLLRIKKKKYYNNYFTKHKTDSKKLWKGINLALEKTKHKKNLPEIIYDSDNKPVNNSLEKANCFAKYFKSIPNKTINKIKPSRFHFMNYCKNKPPNKNYLILQDCSNEEVFKHIMKLNNSTSSGPLKIPNSFLKLIGYPLSIPLACAINKSLRSGYFPQILKLGKQTPVHKTGDCSVGNYRPITVCSSFSKILEKIVRDRLNDFIKENRIINNSQFGFRKGHSTTHATINLLEATLDGLEQKLKVGGVFLDISKAFDCVDHNILLKKLEHYGIRWTSLMWFESYLTNRSQYVEINGEKSETYKSEIGVVQGGTLSATLFILFTNDIVQSSKKLKFSIYADDTSLVIAIENEYYDTDLKNELTKVMNWFQCNKLLINVDKTEYIFFGPHYNKVYENSAHKLDDLQELLPETALQELETPGCSTSSQEKRTKNKKGEFILKELHQIIPEYMTHEYIITNENVIITESSKVKYLGIHFDSDLKFKYQISLVRCKISRMIGVYWKCVDLNIETKKIIYHSLVESYVNYGILVWCSELSKNLTQDYDMNHIPQNLQSINVALNKIMRAIFGLPKFNKKTKMYTESSPLYKKLTVLKLQDLYYYNLCILAHDYFYNTDFPVEIRDRIKLHNTSTEHNTRNAELNLKYPVPNKLNTYRKPTISSAIIWNKIPLTIKQCKSKKKFKNLLKKYFIDKY